MRYLYLLLNIGSLAIPFLFSFHPKLKFYKLWKPLLIGTILTMVVFIPWDVIFTNQGIWKFNDDYFLGITLLQLPMEEWLFFICIPYACVFTHYALLHYFPQMPLAIPATKILSYTLIFILVLLSVINYSKWYTLVNFILAAVLISIVSTKNIKLLSEFYVTFLIMLIPFFIVNGILTGSFIDSEVVWYNNSENLNIRLFTIPVEDMVYAFSMILMNLFIMKQVIAEKI